jgi:2-dehydro-3-deoxygalactonokinase
MPAALVGVDWGTSRFRALLLDRDGTILERRVSADGILNVQNGDFAGVLATYLGGWLQAQPMPVLLSGMIGSRQGWIETPYVSAPAEIADLAAALVPVPFEGGEAYIVTGVEIATATMRDVMRGEETQVFGALKLLGTEGGRFLLPGTHSKWVSVEAGRITTFTTYMTGEIYAACREHTILGRLMPSTGPRDLAAFLHGVKEGARPGGPGALLARLFGVRTAGLFGDMAATGLPDYLSGILIGAELADAAPKENRPLSIVAAYALADLYRMAAEKLGIGVEIVGADCVAHGHIAIAKQAGLLAAA